MFRFAHVWSLPDQCWCCGICVQKNAVTQCVYVAHSSLWHCQRMNYESCWAERTATKQSQNRHGLSWVLGIWEKIKSEGINRRNKRRWAGLGATQHTLDLKLVTTSWCQKRLILRWHSLQPFVWVITHWNSWCFPCTYVLCPRGTFAEFWSLQSVATNSYLNWGRSLTIGRPHLQRRLGPHKLCFGGVWGWSCFLNIHTRMYVCIFMCIYNVIMYVFTSIINDLASFNSFSMILATICWLFCAHPSFFDDLFF